MGGYKRSK